MAEVGFPEVFVSCGVGVILQAESSCVGVQESRSVYAILRCLSLREVV